MVGCCLSYVLTHSAVLLLWIVLHDVEASSCDHIIHKKVGDTVELSSGLPTEGVNITLAFWQYKDRIVVDKDIGDANHPQFKGRVELNKDFNLTVTGLKTQDSGDYSFTSEVNNQQRPTVFICLQVQEIITQQPSMTVNTTWHALNESCTVVGECSAPSHTNVSYNWTMRGQTRSGSRLQYNIQPEDGDTEFTCTIFNFVSETSASKTVKCSNDTSIDQDEEDQTFILLLGVAAGNFLMLIMVAVCITVCVCRRKQRRAGSDSNDLTVYADITDVAPPDRTITMKPSSLYDTIDYRTNAFTPAPQTVYDKIQFNRMGTSSVSPYQEVS